MQKVVQKQNLSQAMKREISRLRRLKWKTSSDEELKALEEELKAVRDLAKEIKK